MYDGPVPCSVESPGAKYKSRGERTIGDFLADSQIRFTYERPTLVIDKGQPKLWYPDFTLDEYKVLIDYAGVKDDPAYHYSTFYKSKVYEKNCLDYLVLTPEHLKNGWKGYLTDSIGQILKDRYESFIHPIKR
jgi:hypothetical protein